MSEYMGLIVGCYEAKEGGFRPGGGSLHSMMTPHGPDYQCFMKCSTEELKPVRVAEGTMVCLSHDIKNLIQLRWNKISLKRFFFSRSCSKALSASLFRNGLSMTATLTRTTTRIGSHSSPILRCLNEVTVMSDVWNNNEVTLLLWNNFNQLMSDCATYCVNTFGQ